MKPAVSKPGAGTEPVANPDVMPRDHVFFQHPAGPQKAEVLSTGRHGITVKHGDKPHKVKWEHVLGHHTRAPQTYDVLDEGEDGVLVKDAGGKRKYLNVPPEARGEKMVLEKSFRHGAGGGRLVVFAKAGPIANRPGLSLQQKTDKNGRASKHWVRTNKPLPKADGHGAAPDEQAAPPTHVAFENGAHRGHGKVISTGKHGHVVEDDEGGKHRILHEQVTHKWNGPGQPDGHPDANEPPAKPNWAARGAGESDKGYAKRVVDKGEPVKHLPEEHDRYFNTKDSKHVPLDKLHSTKSDDDNAQGGENGPKRMLAAYHGALGKRDPVTVMPHKDKDGHFEVVDGNGTLTSAKNMGWKGLPTRHVSREEGERMQAADAAKGALFDPAELEALPAKVNQPAASWDELLTKGTEGLGQLKEALGKVGENMGLKSGLKPDALTDEQWRNDEGFIFIGSLKGADRAKEKVESDYNGDWSQLRDMVRATISVPTMASVKDALGHLKAAGIELAQKPKDRFATPTPEGYRDLMTIVKLPNGMLAEIQVHVKSMTLAKEKGHDDYATARTLQGKYNESEPSEKWSKEDHTKFYDALTSQKKIYSDAWSGAGADKKDASEHLTKSGTPSRMILLVKGVHRGNDLHRE